MRFGEHFNDVLGCRGLFSLRLQAMQLEFMMHSWLTGISHSSVPRWSSNPIKERNFKWAGNTEGCNMG